MMEVKPLMVELAKEYCKEFQDVYKFDENADFVITEEHISKVENWFNSNRSTINCTLGINQGIIQFNKYVLTEQGKADNNRIMLNSYALAYVTDQHLKCLLSNQD
jgi:hypothetical protein